MCVFATIMLLLTFASNANDLVGFVPETPCAITQALTTWSIIGAELTYFARAFCLLCQVASPLCVLFVCCCRSSCLCCVVRMDARFNGTRGESAGRERAKTARERQREGEGQGQGQGQSKFTC